MAGLVNRLAGFVVRKALNLEKYLDDVDSLSFRVTHGDGWIPEQIEVDGPLRIKSNLLKAKTEECPIDVPATVDTDEGGHADRIVVRLPSWARDGLRGYLPAARLPWRPTDRAASSSSPAKSVLPPVKPPPPLRLPGSKEARVAEAEETSSEEASRETFRDRYDEPEKVIVEVHGLDVRLRTYSAKELAELRRRTCDAALEALARVAAGGDLKTDTASSSAARAGRGDGDALPRDASPPRAKGAGGDPDISKEMINKIHRNLCVRCYDARIYLRLEDKPDERAEFRAQRLDFAALMRPVDPDRAEEVWFGGEQLVPTPMQCTLEIRSSDFTASAFALRDSPSAEPGRREERKAQRPSQRAAPPRSFPRAPVEDLLLNIVFPMFNVVGIMGVFDGLPQWPEDDSVLEASSDQPATTAWRFGAPRGALLSLPRGPGGLRPLFSIINAVNAGGAACDPCSAATETCEPGDADARDHERRRSQHHMEVLDPSSSSSAGGGRGSAAAPVGRRTGADRFVIGLCATCATAPGQTLGYEVAGLEDQGSQPSLSARAARLLLRGSPQALELQQRVLEASGAYLPWQRALCHAFYQIWPCCHVQVAAELAGNVTFELGKAVASQDSDTAFGSQRGGVHRHARRMGTDLDEKEQLGKPKEPAEECHPPSAGSRQNTGGTEPEPAAGTAKAAAARRTAGVLGSPDQDPELQMHVVNLGVYFSQLAGPSDWRKNTTVLMETVMVLSRESRRRLLWCNAENFKPPRMPTADQASPPRAAGALPREQSAGRPEEDILASADLAQCVDTFRQLLAGSKPPPVLLTFHSGCFEPEGRAGPKPWSHSRKSRASRASSEREVARTSSRWSKVSRPSERLSRQGSEGSRRESDGVDSALGVHATAEPLGHEALLEPVTSRIVWEWVQLPGQPPRQTFLRCTWLLPVHVACSASEVQSIIATHASAPLHGVAIDETYTDANYPGLAALNVQVVLSGLEVHLEDDDRTGNALVVELQNGLRLDLLPLGKVTSETEKEGGPKLLHVEVKGANAWCSTSTEEVRPVFGLADSLEVSAVYHPRVTLAGDEMFRHRMNIKPRNRRDSDELGFSARTGSARPSMQSGGVVKEEVQCYKLEARCDSQKFWLDVTPQIISVVRLLHEEAIAAESAFRFSMEMENGAPGGESPTAQTFFASPGLEPEASVPPAEFGLEGSESGDPEKIELPTRLELKTSIGTLTLNLCDAISSLIRVKVGVQAAGGVTLVDERGQRETVAATLVSAVELTGEFMGQGENVWEPFLEPWCLGAEVQYDLPRGELDIKMLDVQVASGWLEEEETEGSVIHGTTSMRRSVTSAALTSERMEIMLNRSATAPMPRLRTSMTEDKPAATPIRAGSDRAATPSNSDLGRGGGYVRSTTNGVELLRGGGGKVDRTSPLMINLTPGLLQAVLCFTNQLPDTTDSKKDDEEDDPLAGAADEPRFAALNLTGKTLDTWFHHGNDIENAKKEAKAALWETDPPEPHLTLGTGRLQLVPLDGNITVPANTAMAVQVQEDPEAVQAAQAAQAAGRSPSSSSSGVSRISGFSEDVPKVVRMSVPEETLDLAARRQSKNKRQSRNKTWPPDASREATGSQGSDPESDAGSAVEEEADWDDNFSSTVKRAKSMFGLKRSDSEAFTENSSSSASEASEPKPKVNRFLQRAATRAWLSNEEPTKMRQNILGERHEAAWPRNDHLPILPLTTGWGVLLNDGDGGTSNTKTKRQPDFAVQVLRPEPGRCLLLAAPPLRIFNYTDRRLFLSFRTGFEDKPLTFSMGQCNSATAPARLLGAEQPVDVRRLALPPSPIGRDIESGETGVMKDAESDCGSVSETSELKEEWQLPHNSFCCVPIGAEAQPERVDRGATFHSAVSLEHKQAIRGLSFRFWSTYGGSSSLEPGWSEWIRMGQLPDQEYHLGTCRDANGETLHFRILALREERNKPHPVEVLNIIMLPALTVVNTSPAVLGVDSWNLDQKDLRKAAKPHMSGTMRWLKRTASLGVARAVPREVAQGGALHLYHVNSSAPVGVRLRFSDPDLPVDCRWSEPIYNICASCAGRAQQVDMQVVGMSTPTMQVTCVDYVVGVTCPFWLINPSLQNVMVGRRNAEPFPAVRGIYMLDGGLSGIHLYLNDSTKDVMGVNTLTSRGLASMGSSGGYSLYSVDDYESDLEVGAPIREERHLEVVAKESIAEEEGDDNDSGRGSVISSHAETLTTSVSFTGRSSMDMMGHLSGVHSSLHDKARLPIPVTSTTLSGRLGKHEFTVLREPLPSPFDGLCAPTTCFRLIPQLMVTNDTRYRLHVRRSGTKEVVVVEPDKSLPYWAASRGRRRCIQLQPVEGMELPSLDAWSGEIHCEPLAGGRTALAVRMPRPGPGRSTAASAVSLPPSAKVTSRGDTFTRAPSSNSMGLHSYVDEADETDQAPLVLSVQISDAMEGIISVTVSEKPCWVVACTAKAVRFIAVSTDAPLDSLLTSSTPSGGAWSHMLSSNLSARKAGQHRSGAGQLVAGAGDLVKGAGQLVASGATQTAQTATQTVRHTGEAALKGTGALVTAVQDVAGKAASAALPQRTNETVGAAAAAGATLTRSATGALTQVASGALGTASGATRAATGAVTHVASGALGAGTQVASVALGAGVQVASGALGTATGALGSATGAVTSVASSAHVHFRNFAPLAANIVDRFVPTSMDRDISRDQIDHLRLFGGRYPRHQPVSVGWYQPFRTTIEGDSSGALAEPPALTVVLWWSVDFKAGFGRGESRSSPAPRGASAVAKEYSYGQGTSTWMASASSMSLGTVASGPAATDRRVERDMTVGSRRSDSSLTTAMGNAMTLNSQFSDDEDQVKAVPISINLQRVTPLVMLRAVPRPDGSGRKQLAVMIRIRPRAKVFMQAHAKLLATRANSVAQTPSQRENAKRLAEEWVQLSQSSPELLEVTDMELDQLADMEVEWACGECGNVHAQTGARDPPRVCSRCSADLLAGSPEGGAQEAVDASYVDEVKETLYVNIDRARCLKYASPQPGVQHYVVCRIADRPSSSFWTYSADWAGTDEVRWEQEGTLHDWGVGEDLEFELWRVKEDFESNAIVLPELQGKAVLLAPELKNHQLQKELAFEGTDGCLLKGTVLEVSVERAGTLSDDEEEAEARSTSSLAARATVRLSCVLVSVVSLKARREVFLGEMTGMKFVARRTRGHEKGWLTVAGCRVDCQTRAGEQEEKVGWIQRARRLLFQPRILRTLAKTPAVFASVGVLRREDKTDRTSAMAIGELAPALSVHWDRPATDLYGNTLCVKSIRIDVNRHWEVTIDNTVAQALLTLHHEVTKAIFNSSNRRNADEAQVQFNRITADASDSFVDRFEPPDSQMVVQAEKAQISMFEITVWASVDLSCLPTASMPASLMFLLKLMCITDTFNVEGNSMVFREWKQGAMRQSIRQLCTLFRIYYQGSVLFFVTRTLGSLNLLKAIQVPLMMSRVVTEGIATLVDIADTTILTLADQEALEEKRSKNDHVQSLQEGLEVAATRLWDGFAGIADGLAEPARQYRVRGCLGIPRGICRGLLSCVVKPVSGILQALRAIFQGISAAFGGNIRKDPARHVSKRKANQVKKKDSEKGGPKKHKPTPPNQRGSAQSTIREKGKAPTEMISSKLQDLNNNVVDGFNTSLESTANFLKPHPFYHSMPFLRMPRLLFGPEASLRSWCLWHAELLCLLGHSIMLDLRAAWRLAGGGPADSFHIVMLATDNGLMLVDLGRSTLAPRPTGSGSRSGRGPSHSLDNMDIPGLQPAGTLSAQQAKDLDDYMQQTSERLRKRQQKGRDSGDLLLNRAGVLRRASERSAEDVVGKTQLSEPKLPGMTNWDGNRNNIVAGLVVRPGAFVNKTRRILTGTIEQRTTWCCRRRRVPGGGTSAEGDALQRNEKGKTGESRRGVLGVWRWEELDQIRVEGQAVQATPSLSSASRLQSQFQFPSQNRGARRSSNRMEDSGRPCTPPGPSWRGSALMRSNTLSPGGLGRNTLSPPGNRESITLSSGKRLTTGTTATMTTRDTISQETGSQGLSPGLSRANNHFANRIRRTLSSLASPVGGSLDRQASQVIQDPAFGLGAQQVLVAMEVGGEFSSWPLPGAQLPADEIKAVEQEINLAIQEVRGVL